jgi:hypothetical protein
MAFATNPKVQKSINPKTIIRISSSAGINGRRGQIKIVERKVCQYV